MSHIEVFADQRATDYDSFVKIWIPNYAQFLELLPTLLQRPISPNLNNVLVAGCGTGNEIEVLVKSNKRWHITGFDPSPQMIALARKKLENYPQVSLIEGLITDVPIADVPIASHNSTDNDTDDKSPIKFDGATLLLVLHFLKNNKDKVTLLKDINARLVIGAPLITLDITGTSKHIRQNLAVLKQVLPKDLDPSTVKFRLDRMDNKLHHISEQYYKALCVEAGFSEPVRFFQSTVYMGWIMYKMR